MQQKLNISLDKTTGISCESCGYEVFREGVMLRKASKFLTGTQQDAIVPIQVFACSKCGHVNNDFLPVELQAAKPETPAPTEGKIIPFSK